jgi:transcription antitermination protein NusB
VRRPAHVRSRARSWALQVLYAWDMAGGGRDLPGYAEDVLVRRRVSSRYRPYLDRLLELVAEHAVEIDTTVQEHMPNWRLERLSAIDRAILRIGTAELLYQEDVPGKVAIHEAIRLAERYGGKESHRFVNGVLDAVYQDTLVAS